MDGMFQHGTWVLYHLFTNSQGFLNSLDWIFNCFFRVGFYFVVLCILLTFVFLLGAVVWCLTKSTHTKIRNFSIDIGVFKFDEFAGFN